MALFVLVAVVAVATAALLLLFPGQKTPGATRREIELTDSAYNRFLPIARGRVRVSGDLIWARKVRANKVKAQGGKGGGGSGGSSYEYFADVIYGMADASIFGPAKQILKVWANGNLIYDVTGESELAVKDGVTLRFYLGSDDQEPDVMQTEDEGIYAQGHPRTICIALENFPLVHSGNNIPQLTAEIDYESSGDGDLEYTAGPNSAPTYADDRKVFVDWAAGKAFVTEEEEGQDDSFIHEYNISSQAYVQEISLAAATFGVSFLYGIDPETGYLYGWDATSNFYWQIFDPATGTFIYDAIWVGNQSTELFTIGVNHWIVITSPSDAAKTVMGNDPGNMPTGDLAVFHDAADGAFNVLFSRPSGFNTGTQSVNGAKGEGFFVMWSTSEARVMKYTLSDLNVVTETQVGSFVPADIGTADFKTAIFSNPQIHYDPNARALHFYITTNDSPSAYWIGYDIDAASIIYSVQPPLVAQGLGGITRMQTRLGNSGQLIFQPASGDGLVLLDLLTGATQEVSTGHDWLPILEKIMFYDGVTNCMYGFQIDITIGQQLDKYCFGVGDGFVALQDIIREICVRLNLSEGTDFDVSAVTGGPWGWVIDKRTSGAEALKKVMAYFYTLVGTQDGKIVFRDRGEASQGTIPIGHFVVTSDRKVPWSITRADYEDLPSGAEVEHMDPNRDYENNVMEYHRNNFPDVVMERPKPIALKGDVVMQASQAAPIAYNLTYIPWKESEVIKGKLPFWYMKLVSNDVVDIDFGDGNPLRCRVRKADWTSAKVVEFEGVFEEAGALIASERAVSSGAFFRTGVLEALENSVTQFLDINLLRDSDDLGQTGANTYAGMTGAVTPANFQAATLYRSDDGLNYSDLFTNTVGMIFGVTDTLLSTPADPWGTKFGDFIDVTFVDEGPDPALIQSVTYTAMLNGANPLIVLKAGGAFEIINYMTVTALGVGQYRLSDLLRGRRGTDTMVDGNTIGDTVIIPTLESLGRFSTEISFIGSPREFRTVTNGALFESAVDTSQSIQGNDLKPYAPVYPEASRPVADILLTFKIRQRINTGAAAGVWVHPEVEGSVAYEVDIKDGPAGTIVRTIAASSLPITYTAAQQSTDGFTGSETAITFVPYKLSDLVGRGYGIEYTVEIV